MRICMIGFHGCIRIFKEARALMLQGHQVELLNTGTPFGWNHYDSVGVYSCREQLAKAVESSRADLFHVHNEPDWPVALVKEHAAGRPVVYDLHDQNSLRQSQDPDDDERAAFQAADAIVYVSEPTRDFAEVMHRPGKPHIVLYPYVNREFYASGLDVSWFSLAYEGGLTVMESMTPDDDAPHYRNLLDVVRAFREQKFNVYLFGAGDYESLAEYERLGAFIAKDIWYPIMLAGLRACGFGFVGSPADNPLLQKTMMNKLFEYISQGVVPVVYNADCAAEFCEEFGIGIRLTGFDDLIEQLNHGPDIRKHLLEIREQFAMENHIGKLESLYQQLN